MKLRWWLPYTLLMAVIAVACTIIMHDWQSYSDPTLRNHIILTLQLPLITNAILVGATLAISGGTLQVVLRNPLADPGIIGITSGASLFAAGLLLVPFAIPLPMHYLLPFGCFIGALFSTWLIFKMARRLNNAASAVILAGIAISTLAGAIIGWLYLIADASAMRNLTFWIMGSLHQADWVLLSLSGPIMLLSIGFQLYYAKQMNLLYAGELATAAAGVSPQSLINKCLLVTALGVGAAVSVSGSIAFIGLLVPHVMRFFVGHDNQKLLPVAALTGALLLLLVVAVAELFAIISLPVSMVTATIGGPMLLAVLYRGRWRA
ncbi:FecCD family ABC transporter permease [Alteromonas sp. ASW11-130]|uniref:FecCD family ABC transporter permease n=1 Tax=Alteromonas sp. ASW11-130 TaxID=3015775 RepID=UPI002241BF75|nr:iron ABC transporter permease [Alteromonas sp. ASW11-130]MCW8091371.1 iron ABC transporter permease [Alteromonas sp. ASW11-130]